MLRHIIGITLKFDAAHFLPGYKGPCSNLHGHTWRVDYRIAYWRTDECGIAVDFKVLKRELAETLPDHTLINDLVTPPSAEKLVGYLWERAEAVIDRILVTTGRDDLQLDSVRLWESEVAYAQQSR
jgi:6-pyruvoyltetrahydropterin/6-carboxytetrahydropterin synthase